MPRISRRRRSRRRLRSRLIRTRVRRRFRRLRRRRFSRRAKRFFTRKQLVPPSVVVKITMSVPFILSEGTATDDFTAFGAYIANSLDTSDATATPAAFGTYTLLGGLSAAAPLLCSGNTNGASLVTKDSNTWGPANRPRYISTNYFHMGNMWKRYRVLSSTITFSCENMMFQNSTGSNRATAHGVLNLFATPGAESIANTTAMIYNWTRPAIFGQRNAKTHTIHNQYTSPSILRHTCSASRLVRNVYPTTTEDYTGTCTPGTNGTLPTYARPTDLVYHGWTFHPYGAAGTPPRSNFLPSSTLLSGYITVSYKVFFSDPHVNSDFVNPL